MSADRRILTPVAATLIAGAIVGAATVGGTIAGSQETAVKSDRFAVVGEQLCEGQSWPNLTPECLSWKEGEPTSNARVRFVTFSQTDDGAGTTTLTRTREITTN
ncbi:MAG: hypothetical protein AAGB11_13365 [Pseudomonadota bacterium]